MKIHNLDTYFGKVLRNLRDKKGITQEALAESCDLDRTYISLLERGLRQPTLMTLFRLAKELGISPSEMVRMLERSLNENY